MFPRHERIEDPPGTVSHIIGGERYAFIIGWDREGLRAVPPAPPGFYDLRICQGTRRLILAIDTSGMANG